LSKEDRKSQQQTSAPLAGTSKPKPADKSVQPKNQSETAKSDIAKSSTEPVVEGIKTPPSGSEGQDELAAIIKDIENAIFAIKFYPVAVNEESKKEAVAKIISLYESGNETVRQLLLYMLHENIAQSAELKAMHNYDYARMKNPSLDPTQIRMSVYRAMFNYNTSIEGLVELIRILGRLRGSDDAAKVLTYHFSHLCTVENELSHMLRAAVIDALGKSESHYALRALIEYAKYNDNERTLQRVVSALVEWDQKIDSLKLTRHEKEKLREQLKEIIAKDLGGSHYG